MNQKWTFVGQ